VLEFVGGTFPVLEFMGGTFPMLEFGEENYDAEAITRKAENGWEILRA
jgi:hypothetical protein